MPLLKARLAACLPLIFTPVAVAQIIPPPLPQMSAPVRVSPASGIYAYQYGTPNLSFVWDQYPAIGFPSQFPTHFLFCLKRILDPDCSHATAVVSLLPAQIPRVTLRNSFTQQPIGTRYTYTPTIPDTKVDYIVAWQVLGCTSNADSSCRNSSHAWMVASTVELQAGNISGNAVSGNGYSVSAQGINVGSRSLSSHPSQAHHTLWIREVLIDSTGTLCRTDPNAADIRNDMTLSVIDGRGTLTPFANLPRDTAGNYIANNVIAIYRSSGFLHSNQTMSGPLHPNQSEMVDFQTITVPPNTRPRAFAAGVLMDSSQVIPEPNETDNGHAECEVVF